ncbi:MAG: hypothetical protein Q9161_001284 [Pseudevernia consocians]
MAASANPKFTCVGGTRKVLIGDAKRVNRERFRRIDTVFGKQNQVRRVSCVYGECRQRRYTPTDHALLISSFDHAEHAAEQRRELQRTKVLTSGRLEILRLRAYSSNATARRL